MIAIIAIFIFMNDELKFYKSAKWLHKREEVLKRDHYECQRCKHKDKYKNVNGVRTYTKAKLVHHDFRFKEYPQYALMDFVNGKRNLYSLCQSCHEIEHEAERGLIQSNEELNEEKW